MTEMHNQPHASAVMGEVNAPADVELFDEAGKRIRVALADEPHWLSKGYTRTQLDPAALLEDLMVNFDAARSAIAEYAKAVLADRIIDHADEGARATAHVAMREVEQAWF